MSSDGDTTSDDSRSSSYNDGNEAILANAKLPENNSSRSTPESHWGCTMYHGHGQGAPVYSCGCYKHNVVRRFKSEASPPDNELADEFHLGAERHKQPEPVKLEARSEDGGLEDTDGSHRKRKWSEDDSTLRNFGHDITNIRATSVPVIGLPPEKRRKVGGNLVLCEGELLAKVMQEVEGVREAMSRIEVIFDRQRTVLLEICNAIENHGM
ncbi:hypothetical protein CY34DRAFT_16925 [Suillus luteus UH-Slu-Lm8-n1]|uniref:Uncharacterized protein n=1 Tax=Suillus luteus UH-Slu-Lm8-n1 TaxID=930992 RepID=A0A0D0AMZ7_9AGAM|nr:hypothetical protein CY34DRAFT_16925 [Suillus luteus UH-Slu-Lm8-n1]